jgi:3-oxoacyl-[acyl-carrier-protein] synthase-3
MSGRRCSVITGTGRYVPERRVPNESFLGNRFFEASGEVFGRPTAEIIDKFQQITGITERRWVDDDLVTSDIASFAAEAALESSGADREGLDYLIVAHNFGDVAANNRHTDLVPSLAARVKERLAIENPRTISYDVPFGCPGWLQALIQADYYLRSGDAERALVVGAETLSRISDPHDRDSMIYADGAGAVLVEARESEAPVGILSHAARSDTLGFARLLRMERSYNPEFREDTLFLKMTGNRLYEYALKTVPQVVKDALDRAGVALGEIRKILIHQANEKMDDAIIKRLAKLCGAARILPEVVPMTISWLGNSSVATLPTLLDLVVRRELDGHELSSGDLVVFASVGAGMNVNSLVYRMP